MNDVDDNDHEQTGRMDMTRYRHVSRRDLFKLGAAAGAASLMAGALRVSPAGAEEGAEIQTSEEEALPQVPRRILGKTGQSIPILLMGGGMQLDARFDPKLAECYRFGVNYIDAADCYSGGSCEPAVASYTKRAKNRDNLWITSKSDKHDPEGFEATVNTSLQKLETDYIDLYFLHALQDGDYLNDDLRVVVERLKEEGKIRYFGFSCHHGNVAELLELAAETEWVDAVMFRYNFRQYGNETLNQAIDAAYKANVGLIAMKTQASEASFEDAWKKYEDTGKWNKHQAVLKAVWADDRIAAAVSHMDTFEKLQQNIAAALDTEDLGQSTWEALEKYASATRPYACDGCDHICGPAVDGEVEIGATLRYLMYHDSYGEKDKARELFAKLPPAARRLGEVDFEPANRACPNGVDVAWHMKRARMVFNA